MKRSFFDSNIILYSLDNRELAKKRVAIELIMDHLRTATAVISTQVVIESFHNALGKMKLSSETANEAIQALRRLEIIDTDATLVFQAVELCRSAQLSIFDAAAAKAGCETVYTEDLNHGQMIGGVKVVNPFVA
ncbi:MAG TPA: PIN domain-containing protein [Tepidisphaeraceae bacterium]|jgi:predicted nucleic acid-binding protein